MLIQKKGLSKNFIKCMAMFTMFLNHFAHIFLTEGTVLYTIFVDIGYFTAITMCYFLVEGYRYTHSKKKYALRLLIFGIITQIPYLYAFHYLQFNMMFTLLFCLCFLWVDDTKLNIYVKNLIKVLLVIVCYFSDWSVFALFFTWLFYKSYGIKSEIKKSYIICIVIYLINNYVAFIDIYSPIKALSMSVGATLGLVVSAIIIIYFYDSEQSYKNRKIMKYLFYWFYPVHIILLLLIKSVIAV